MGEPEQEKRRPGYIYDPQAPLPEHLRPKPEPPLPRRRLKDVDVGEAAYRLKTLLWSITGLIMGFLMGVTATVYGRSPILIPICTIAVWAFVYFGTRWLTDSAGRAGASVYFSGGGTVPAVRQYSLADSMIARARFDEAAAELQRAAEQYPDDPEPCLRLARLLRDQLGRHDDAVRWFRQAVTRTGCTAATEIAATRELIEIYTHRLQTPTRALPDLARLAARHPHTPAAEWARRQLQEIKHEMRQEDERG